MQRKIIFLLLSTVLLLITILFIYRSKPIPPKPYGMIPMIDSREALIRLFPKTKEAIRQRVDNTINEAIKQIHYLTSIPAHKRTFENTVRQFDGVTAGLAITSALLQALRQVYDKQFHETLESELKRLQDFTIDQLIKNHSIYQAIIEYAEGNSKKESLLPDEQFFLQETIDEFKRNGINLAQKDREEVAQLQKKISLLCTQFETNIIKPTEPLACTRAELAGLDKEFINSLERGSDGKYLLPLNMAVTTLVLNHCEVSRTRERYWVAWYNRAYPENNKTLTDLIAARGAFAHKVGFNSFAQLSLSNLMAKTPNQASAFLKELDETSREKYLLDIATYKKNIPTSVSLTPDGKFQPWDFNYVVESYKKRHFNIDNEVLANYFPTDQTIDRMLSIFEQFLNLEFRREPLEWQWHKDVRYVGVYSKDGSLEGHLLLDLFPRPGKYSHACAHGLVSGLKTVGGQIRQPVVFIVTNFPKPTASKPSLLKIADVRTLFHEFGHAITEILGKTNMAGFSGNNVRHDFVEVMSQLFEEWPSDTHILKFLSSHYKTGKPLDSATINRIISSKKVNSGFFIQQMVARSQYSLACYGPGKKDPVAISNILEKPFESEIKKDPRTHFCCSFIHLASYNARYYGYLWAEVYSHDFFATIKAKGLLNGVVGKQLINIVMSKGGSVEPDVLAREFLGRPVSIIPFRQNYGL